MGVDTAPVGTGCPMVESLSDLTGVTGMGGTARGITGCDCTPTGAPPMCPLPGVPLVTPAPETPATQGKLGTPAAGIPTAPTPT